MYIAKVKYKVQDKQDVLKQLKDKGLTLEYLGKQINVSKQYLSKVISGSKYLTYKTIKLFNDFQIKI